MMNYRWEIPALSISAGWVLVVGWLGYLLTPQPEIDSEPIRLSWSEATSVSEALCYSGAVELSLDRPTTEKLAFKYIAERGEWREEWQRTVPVGAEKIVLPYALSPNFRDDEFVDEEVILTLVGGQNYTLNEGLATHTVLYRKLPRGVHIRSTKSEFVEGTVEELEFYSELEITSIPAKQDYRLECELSGSGIDQGYFSTPSGSKTVILRMNEDDSESERVVLKQVKRLQGKKPQVTLTLKPIPPPESGRPELELITKTLTIISRPLPPKKYQLYPEPAVLAEGEEGTLHLEILSGAIRPDEKISVTFSSPGVKFRDTRDGQSVLVDTLTRVIDTDNRDLEVAIQPPPDKIGLQPKREVEIKATIDDLSTQSLATQIEVLDRTPVRLSIEPAETEFLVVEGGPARKLTFTIDDKVTVARDLKIPIALKKVDEAGLELVQIPGAGLMQMGEDQRTGVATIPKGLGTLELAISATENQMKNELDRTVALFLDSKPEWDFNPDSPKTIRLVVQESARYEGNLLVLVSANRFNSGERKKRDLLADLDSLSKVKLDGTGWELVNKSIFVVDATGKIFTSQSVLAGQKLTPFQNDPVKEVNTFNTARQTLLKQCGDIKLTCLFWLSETETNAVKDKAGKDLSKWATEPVLLLWAGGFDDRPLPGERSTAVLSNWKEKEAGKPVTAPSLLKFQIGDSLADRLEKAATDLRTLLK